MPGRRSQIRFPVQATSKRRHFVTPGEQRRLREQIRFERPETRVLLMSAQLESSAENIPILRKPFRPRRFGREDRTTSPFKVMPESVRLPGCRDRLFRQCENGRMALEEELQKIYDSEIHVDIGWLWHGGIDVSIGNGEFTGNVQTVAEVLPWLQETIAKHYPESKYNVERMGGTIR